MTKPMAKAFEWPAGFSSLILFANEGVADFSGHRLVSRTGVMPSSVVGRRIAFGSGWVCKPALFTGTVAERGRRA
jgi:hypothetical protein